MKLFVLLAVSFLGLPVQAKYGGGTGEPNDPYLIYTAEQLNEIGLNEDDWDKHFKLMTDIDLGQLDGKDGRPPFNMIGTYDCYDEGCGGVGFAGVFDGNNCTMSNLNIDGGVGTGLFRHIDWGTIKDLGIVDPCVVGFHAVGALVGQLSHGTIKHCYIEGGYVFGFEGVGGLVGSTGGCSYSLGCFEGGEVSHCYVAGTVVGGNFSVGGIIGWSIGIITECYSTTSVIGNAGSVGVGGLAGSNSGTITQSFSSDNVLGNNYVGGLVGGNGRALAYPGYYLRGIITDCYSTGSVDGNDFVGGFVGVNSYGMVTNCYSTGDVAGDSNVGGLAGYNEYGEYASSFWDIETSGQLSSYGGTGLPTAEMHEQSTFTDWDFVNVWDIGENQTYPYLRVYLAGDINRDFKVNFLDFALIAMQWCEDSNP